MTTATETQFTAYLTLMQKWNRIVNLTAILDLKQMYVLHILDSLSILPYLHGKQIIDVGSGAGLPGIPLAIASPEHFFCLLDSNGKKIRFLNQVVYELGLKNVTTVHSRAEDFHPETCFDTIVTRAFANLQTMLTSTEHLLCKDGLFLAMKGLYPEEELTHIPDQFKVMAVHRLLIKELQAERHVVCLQKGNLWEKSLRL